jgi:N-acetylglucosamine kinase-like BadF-type ATPase
MNTFALTNPNDKTKTPRLFLGIDGGGTKTAFALANEEGTILARKTLGACNPNDVGFLETERVLKEGIEELCAGYDMAEISVYAGLAGCSSAENLPKIGAFLSQFGFLKYANHNDAQNAVAAALGRKDGVAVIMGTGSIAYAKKGSDLYRIGGYGYLFGDKGSGFAIGRDVILAALSEEDGSGRQTALYQPVLALCGGETVLSKIDFFYKEGKKEIARYAPLAFEAFKKGDAVARGILEENLSAIARLITGGAGHLKSSSVKVALCGGVTRQEEILLPMLAELLSKDSTAYELSVCQKEPVWGALLLAGMPCEE